MTELDKILITNLHLRGIIGVNDWERKEKQDIRISLILYTDTRPVARNDDLKLGINYRTVSKRVGELVENSSYYLVETLAHEIARICILEFKSEKVQVRVEKPAAVRFSDSVGVEIVRTMADFQ